MAATCRLCGHKDILGVWDKSAWTTARQSKPSMRSPPLLSVPGPTKEAAGEKSDGDGAGRKKRRKGNKNEGLQALLAKSQAREGASGKSKEGSGLSGLFRQLG